MTVCTGNICRSPVAEGLLKAALPQCEVWSAGLSAMVGEPADKTAVEIALKHHIDIRAHRAQQIASWMISHAELVLVMEISQQRHLQAMYPSARGKIHRLGQYGDSGPFDIVDPYKQPHSAFEISHAVISRGVSGWVNRIRQLA